MDAPRPASQRYQTSGSAAARRVSRCSTYQAGGPARRPPPRGLQIKRRHALPPVPATRPLQMRLMPARRYPAVCQPFARRLPAVCPSFIRRLCAAPGSTRLHTARRGSTRRDANSSGPHEARHGAAPASERSGEAGDPLPSTHTRELQYLSADTSQPSRSGARRRRRAARPSKPDAHGIVECDERRDGGDATRWEVGRIPAGSVVRSLARLHHSWMK